jgi:hypothetical protein
MAIFPRRVVQRILNQSGQFLSAEHSGDCARRLNCDDPQDHLAAEWELFVLDAFNKLGRIGHEEDLGGSSRLDLSFYGNSTEPLFVADIRSVSDEGLHKENPVAELQRQLHRHLKKRDIKNGSFRIEVPSIDRLPQLNKKLKLSLPPKGGNRIFY